MDFLKFRPPPSFILTPRLLNLIKISDPFVYFDPPSPPPPSPPRLLGT